MPTRFFPAPEVEQVAENLIEEHHNHLINHKVRVEYLFRNVPAKKNGATVWGDARKITSLNAFLAGEEEDQDEGKAEPFFVICMALPIWTTLNEKQRIALTDHELAHCGAEYDDKGKTRLFLIPHDLEEFRSIYARHGDWAGEIEQFLRAREKAQEEVQTTIYDVDGVAPDGDRVPDWISGGAERRLITGSATPAIETTPLKALPSPDVIEGEYRDEDQGDQGEGGAEIIPETPVPNAAVESGWEDADSPEIPAHIQRIREEESRREFGSGDEDIPMSRPGRKGGSRRVPAGKGNEL